MVGTNGLENLEQVFSLRLPRCGICSSAWYSERECPAADKEDVAIASKQNNTSSNAHLLLPMPKCTCSSKFVKINDTKTATTIDQAIHTICNNKNEKDKSDQDWIKWFQELNSLSFDDNNKSSTKRTSIKPTRNKASSSSTDINVIFSQVKQRGMCRPCLQNLVKNSNDVIEHDYLDPNQPNVKFSVEAKCPNCKKKYRERELLKLLDEKVESEGGRGDDNDDSGSVNRGRKTGGINTKGNESIREWTERVQDTIQFVHFLKRLKRKMKKNQQPYTLEPNDDEDKNDPVQNWLGDLEEHSSDDCFSDGDDDDDKANLSSRHSIRRTEVKPGEMKEMLLQRDPLFRQECKDLDFIKAKTKTKEGRIELGLEENINEEAIKAQMEQDLKMAEEIQKKEKTLKPIRVHDSQKALSAKKSPAGPASKNCDINDSPLVAYFKTASKPPSTANQHSRKQKIKNDKIAGAFPITSISSDSSSDFSFERYYEKLPPDLKSPPKQQQQQKLKGQRRSTRKRSNQSALANLAQKQKKNDEVFIISSSFNDDSDISNASDHMEQNCSSTSSTTAKRFHQPPVNLTIRPPKIKPDNPPKHKSKSSNYKQTHVTPRKIGSPAALRGNSTKIDISEKSQSKKSSIDNSKLEMLLSMGFDEFHSRQALKDAENDENLAVTILISGSRDK